jgi:hypothetical protein
MEETLTVQHVLQKIVVLADKIKKGEIPLLNFL